MRRIRRLPAQIWRLLGFSAWYSGRLVLANLSVARQVLTPRPKAMPGIARVPLHSRRERHLTLLIGLVTLTPGTLVLEAQRTPPVLYVHALDAPDPEALRRQVQQMEERMLAVLDPDL